MRTFRSRPVILLTIVAIAAIVITVLGVAFLNREAALANYVSQGGSKQGYPAGHFMAYFGGPSPASQPTLPAAEQDKLNESLMNPKYFSREETEAAVEFKLHIPTYIPQRLEFMGTYYYPTRVGQGSAREDTWTVIMFWREASPSKMILGLDQVRHLGKDYHFKVAEEAVQPLTIKGRPAIYIEGAWMDGKWRRDLERSIAWSDDQFAYRLWSTALPLEELRKVAESMP